MAKSSKLHVDDGICLDLGKGESLLKGEGCYSIVCTVLDDLDDFIDVLKTDLKTKKDMLPFLCLFKIIACPTLDYVLPVVNVYLKHLLDVEELWCTIVKGKVVDVEVRLEGSALPEHVQHYIRNCIAL